MENRFAVRLKFIFLLFQPVSLEDIFVLQWFSISFKSSWFLSFVLAMISILCLKIRKFSNLPVFHSKQSFIILQFIPLIAIIYSRRENKKKLLKQIFD